MKNPSLLYLFLFILSSCISTNQSFFADPNYLSSEEFSSAETINESYPAEIVSQQDTSENIDEEYYISDNYYDFTYSSRIRRFHNPIMYNYGFYSGFYTDYHWYNPDPFYWGSSIYSGYNWNSPYYSFSPYYNYYSPFHYDYYSWSHHGHHGHHGYNNYNQNSNYYNSNDENSYSYGPRGSLSTKSNISIKSKHIKNKSSLSNYVPTQESIGYKENFKNKKPSNIKSNSIVNTQQQTKNNTSKNSIKSNSYKKPNYSKKENYKAKNNRSNSYKSRPSNSRSSGSRSSGNKGNGRSPKPRK